MKFQVASAQFAPEKGQLDNNLDTIADWIAQAKEEGVDLLTFPECAVSGYYLEGGTLELSMSSEELVNRLLPRIKVTRPIDVLIGFFEKSEGCLYNSAAYIEITPGEAKLKGVYRKFFLATYGVFDEERFVSRGSELGLIETRFGKVGILICEDVWHSVLPTLCAASGARLMLVPSASPGRGFSDDHVGNLGRYERMLRAVSEEHGVYCVNSQLCGFEGGKGLVGGSSIVDPFGITLTKSPILEPHMICATVDYDLVEVARAQTPLISDLKSNWNNLARLAQEIGS